MTAFTFQTEVWLPAARRDVFAFFADARNLQAITPPWLNFEILTPGQVEMRAGALIDYRLRVRFVSMRWRTEIVVWEPSERFVDVQRRGPYRRWEHTHTFSDLDGGTLCRDQVEYSVPGGRLVNWLVVRRDIEKIFAYRSQAMSRFFPVGG